MAMFINRCCFLILILCIANALGQSTNIKPHIGYLYPAGGQQGKVIMVTAGGQYLNGVTDAYISGEGVHVSFIKFIKPFNIDPNQRLLLQKRLKELEDKRLSESSGNQEASGNVQQKPIQKNIQESMTLNPTSSEMVAEVNLPEHPLLFDLDKKSYRELEHVRNILLSNNDKRQPNSQISQMAMIKVVIEPNAEPGDRALRLLTPNGLTNPMVFQVGLLSEIRELETNGPQAVSSLPEGDTIVLPALLNGQILPGDTDCFRFHAQKGQHIVIDVHARRIMPYLADAVPGWFQAAVSIYDIKGNELAFADHYNFNPDPILCYKILADGEYILEVRDSIYRGREDFVYRIAIGELPLITQIFPLGGRQGVELKVSFDGYNLSSGLLSLDNRPGDNSIRQAAFLQNDMLSNTVLYAIDNLPECIETEYNNTIKDAQKIDLLQIINGRIGYPGDVDVLKFQGHKDEKIVAEVNARRLNSPLDSLLRLTDITGKVLEWNDDYVLEDNYLYKDESGLITHHADSYIMAELPQDGMYFVHLSDAQNHGGSEYCYRLRISVPRPDFSLIITPSSLNFRAAGVFPVTIYALRKDGFSGEINVVLKNAPPGFGLSGARIPAGSDHVRMTLTTATKPPEGPIRLQLEGRASISGQTVIHSVMPAEDMMQAFLYRHLVPSKELLVFVSKNRAPMFPMEFDEGGSVKIPKSGSARVLLKTPKGATLQQVQQIQLQLNEPPKGITIQDVNIMASGIEFHLKADENFVKSDLKDNLIVELFREIKPAQQEGKPPAQSTRNSIGFLPAIPVEVVTQ
jgi:hypothetical protein